MGPPPFYQTSRAERCHGLDPSWMALERAARPSSCSVPEPDRLVVGGGCDQLAIRRECHGVDFT
jgi:hypothetical protein